MCACCECNYLHDDGFGGGDSFRHASGSNDEENGAVAVILSSGEKLLSDGTSVVRNDGDDDGFVLRSLNFGSKFCVGVDGLVSGAGVLLDPGNNVLCHTTSFVLLRLAVDEPLQGWKTFNLELGAQLLLAVCVDACKHNLAVAGLELLGSSLVLGGELLAVAAPGRKELNENVSVGVDDLVEVLSGREEEGEG
jgi:hypothetical protein